MCCSIMYCVYSCVRVFFYSYISFYTLASALFFAVAFALLTVLFVRFAAAYVLFWDLCVLSTVFSVLYTVEHISLLFVCSCTIFCLQLCLCLYDCIGSVCSCKRILFMILIRVYSYVEYFHSCMCLICCLFILFAVVCIVFFYNALLFFKVITVTAMLTVMYMFVMIAVAQFVFLYCLYSIVCFIVESVLFTLTAVCVLSFFWVMFVYSCICAACYCICCVYRESIVLRFLWFTFKTLFSFMFLVLFCSNSNCCVRSCMCSLYCFFVPS